jgi:integrase
MKRKRSSVPIARVTTNEGDFWVLRPRVAVIVDGKPRTIQRAIRIGACEGRSRRPPQYVVEMARGEVRRLKGSSTAPPLKGMRVEEFFAAAYLRHVEDNLRPSTSSEYKLMWARYVKGQFIASMWLRDVRTSHVQRFLEEVARKHCIGRRTLAHVKALLSGLFRYAAQQDYLDVNRNPVTMSAIPGFAPNGSETFAYSLEEVFRMLQALSDPARTIVSVAAFTGLRMGEIRGLRWEEYQSDSDDRSLPVLRVERSVWRKFTTEPKTDKSKAAVPVIPQLAAQLVAWWRACGSPADGPMFANKAGKPLNLDSLHWRHMKPALHSAEIQWHGWHGFRRGLASNLNRLGVDDSVIQAILRHSHISVTQACYIKTIRPDVDAAMVRFSEAIRDSCSSDVLWNGNFDAALRVQ